MRNHGLQYDSSIFPLTAHDRYGINNADRFANKVRDDLWEFPVSTVHLGNSNWPVAGGGYFRLFPLWLTRRAIQHINAEGHPAIIYLHPWEFDPDQPRVPNAPLLSRFRHYVNLRKTERRLRTLLQEFRFGTMCEVFADRLTYATENRRAPKLARGYRVARLDFNAVEESLNGTNPSATQE